MRSGNGDSFRGVVISHPGARTFSDANAFDFYANEGKVPVRRSTMADVEMPESVPCKFDTEGWAPCRKPSTNGLCSKHEKLRCISCGEQALRSCDAGMGGLACGAHLCGTCQHTLEGGGTHVIKAVYDAQSQEASELRRTGKESNRMLALRGVRTDVELPSHLEELLKGGREGFTLQICYLLVIKHGLMGTFPAILKDTKIVVITPDKDSIVRVWRSLRPTDSRIIVDSWMVSDELGVGYRMCSESSERAESRPHKIFAKAEIEGLFAKKKQPFEWTPGLFGAEMGERQFEALIEQELAA